MLPVMNKDEYQGFNVCVHPDTTAYAQTMGSPVVGAGSSCDKHEKHIAEEVDNVMFS
jgi:hypothetical protein